MCLHTQHIVLTLTLQQNLICNTVRLVTLGDAEYKPRYYTESFYLHNAVRFFE